MDFDDMPDSYFAFLSNQRKVAEPDAMKLAGASGDENKAKVRARSSGSPSMAPKSSSSVPSLPSISRSMSSGSVNKPVSGVGSGAAGMVASSFGASPTGNPLASLGSMGGAAAMERQRVPPPRSNSVVYVLIAALIVAIAALAYMLATQ